MPRAAPTASRIASLSARVMITTSRSIQAAMVVPSSTTSADAHKGASTPSGRTCTWAPQLACGAVSGGVASTRPTPARNPRPPIENLPCRWLRHGSSAPALRETPNGAWLSDRAGGTADDQRRMRAASAASQPRPTSARSAAMSNPGIEREPERVECVEPRPLELVEAPLDDGVRGRTREPRAERAGEWLPHEPRPCHRQRRRAT